MVRRDNLHLAAETDYFCASLWRQRHVTIIVVLPEKPTQFAQK